MKTRNSSLFVFTFSVASALGITPVAHGQSGTDATMFDKHFVTEALKGGMAEVQMGRLAEEKGESSDVKSFGHKMVEDHTKLGNQMKQVASQIGLSVPTSPTILEQAEIKKLSGLTGNDFDQEYIKAMLKAHEGDLKDFKKEADTGTSSVVKEAASQGAEVVSSHLSMIQQIAQSHNIAMN
jgi:putative membrane protein